jgi:DNA-directed RNA polymerase II subunit RPB1
MKIIAEWRSKKTTADGTGKILQEFTAEDIHKIFKRISEKEMEIMGFNPKWNRPEWMICTVLPAPPPSVRPSIIEENGQRREDDLTHKLSDIIKTNNSIIDKMNKGASEESIKYITMLLQYHVFTFIDNQIPGLAPSQQRNGRKLKSVSDRMKKKEGRIRGNLNGKRVDQSARSVITPDPYISIDELGVPIKVAINITFPEVVNNYNIQNLKKLVQNGSEKWPGAKYVKKLKEAITINLKYADLNKVADNLKHGDIVHRHLTNGDFVLFNRQPSLHKMSMMCHKVVIMPYQTFRLNVLDTPPYNADFDGDEMNLHCPQNIQTMNELMDIAAVPYMILAPRDGKPIIEVVQDTLLGAFRLTKDTTKIQDKTMANLQMVNSYFSGVLEDPNKNYMYTGKEAYSQILPPGLFISRKNKKDEKVVINNSKLISGTLDKTVFHGISTGLLPIIFHDYGPFEVRKFLDNTQRLICRWLLTAGFSVGISDLVTDTKTDEKLKSKIKEMKTKAYSKLDEIRRGMIDNNSIFNNEEYIEREIIGILNETTSEVGKIGLSQIDENTNRMINMVKSGSKGKETNVAQMIACVGQQNVDGKRITYGFTDRTLPHFTKYDDGPEARGFVENSFISGLTPQEVFFHAMGGREGLIDTAVKTSETGYIQRRLVKAMEDAKIQYDNTVRTAVGSIIQYIYGEDGMDGCKIETQIIPIIDKTTLEIDNEYHIKKSDNIHLYMTDEAGKSITEETYKKCKEHFENILDDKYFLIKNVFNGEKNKIINYPIPFDRIINTASKRLQNIGIKAIQTDLTPDYVFTKVEKIKNDLFIKDKDQGMRFFHILLHLHLCPKKLIMEYNFTKEIFDWIVEQIYEYFNQAIAQPGEMVGIVAAQTIGEMGTQMTLDSFHVSGTAAAVKATSGVPRLKEILSATKKTKTPTLLIYMKSDVASIINPTTDEDGEVNDPRLEMTKNHAINIKNSIEITKLSDILEYSEIYWDNGDRFNTTNETDKGLLQMYKEFEQLEELGCKTRSSSPWVLRLKFNKEKMNLFGLKMIDIYTKLNIAYDNYIDCIYSDDNAEDCIFRIKLTELALKDIDSKDEIAAIKAMEHNIVYQVLLKGYKGIKKVSLNKKKYSKFNYDKNTFDNIIEWVLDTDGTNLIDILSNPNIDATRTISNDIREVYETLGIEAARNSLYRELVNVTSEGSMNYRHMSLLIDTMTYKGQLMSIDRHGINRGDIGPLAKSSFEETTDMLINASIFAEYDKVNGVSANVMLGQQPPCGTGDSRILIDEEHMMELLKDINIKEYNNNKDSLDIINEDDDTTNDNVCLEEDIIINFKTNIQENKCFNIPEQKIKIV